MRRSSPPHVLPSLAATVSLLAVATAGMTAFVAPPGRAATRRAAAAPTVGGLAVYVAYAEDKETNNPNPAAFPTPWSGSPNTIFLGNPILGQSACGNLTACYDAGAIRLDNTGATAVTVTSVSVDDHSSVAGGKVFNNLWGSFTVPAGKSVILTEDPPGNNPGYDNFDTSSYPNNNCTPLTVAPTVTLTIAGVATTLADSTHVLDTGGIDRGSCTPRANESIQWRPLGASGSDTATLTLGPTTATPSPGQPVTETAMLRDGGGAPLPNTAVTFVVITGPNAGLTGHAATDSTGQASFTYASSAVGTDTLIASVSTVGAFASNQAPVSWSNGSPPPPPAPVRLSNLSVADTANAGNWSLQADLQAGAVQYGDRGYTLSAVPTPLAGAAWIRSAMASKAYTGNPTVSFTTGQQAMVYVALDTRLAVPPWLDTSWTDTGLTLSNSNTSTGSNRFLLYGKLFPAGTVALGPNSATGNTGVNMYTVLAEPSDASAGTPTPTPTPSPTATPTSTPSVQLSGLTVSDSANAAKWSLQADLQAGAVQYGDRGYTLSAVPSGLLGAAWIRTANASKAYTGSPTVSFAISQQATVYVALDSRLAPPPWMDATWTKSGMTLTDSQAAGANSFVLYAKVFPAGMVALGPNASSGATGVNMYTVIVR